MSREGKGHWLAWSDVRTRSLGAKVRAGGGIKLSSCFANVLPRFDLFRRTPRQPRHKATHVQSKACSSPAWENERAGDLGMLREALHSSSSVSPLSRGILDSSNGNHCCGALTSRGPARPWQNGCKSLISIHTSIMQHVQLCVIACWDVQWEWSPNPSCRYRTAN